MDIVTRDQWGARPPRSATFVSWSNRTEFIVHYSAGPTTQTVRQIQDFHMDTRGWSDIGYNFLVDVAGRLYIGRGWDRLGTHTVGHNTSGIAVCFIGRDGDAGDAARETIAWLAAEADRQAGRRLTRYGHRDLDQTECPGDQLHSWVWRGMPTEGKDMLTDAQAAKLDTIHHATTMLDDTDGEGRIALHQWAGRAWSLLTELKAQLVAIEARLDAVAPPSGVADHTHVPGGVETPETVDP